MAALFRLLYFYCARYDCYVGAAHIPGIENSEADAISRREFARFRMLRPSASRDPSPIPDLFNPWFFSEFQTSAAGRESSVSDGSRNCKDNTKVIRPGLPTVRESHAEAPPSRPAPIFQSDPGESSIVRGGIIRAGPSLHFSKIVCGRGLPSHPNPIDSGRPKNGEFRPTGKPETGQTPSFTETANYNGYSDQTGLPTAAIPQRERSMGGDCDRSVRTVSTGGISPQPAIGILSFPPSNDSRPLLDIEFGWSPPEGYEDRPGRDNPTRGDSEVHLPKIPAMSKVPSENNGGQSTSGSSQLPIISAECPASIQGNRGPEDKGMDASSGPLKRPVQWPFPSTRGRDLRSDGRPNGRGGQENGSLEGGFLSGLPGSPTRDNGSAECPSRAGRIDYRKREREKSRQSCLGHG